MDEATIQAKRREQDEASTQHRAAILGLKYLDMRNLEAETPLVKDLFDLDYLKTNRLIPLSKGGGGSSTEIGVTAQTPQSLLKNIRLEYNDKGRQVDFYLISNSSYRAMMLRYDPPKKVVYNDIVIAKEGDLDTLAQVSQTLESVGVDAVFDYIIKQADRLGASDIHIENERLAIRVRMRVDGALHVVAQLSKDRYRVLMSELSSRANVSMASNQPQSGHIQQEISTGGETHLLNIRIETVPTLYGQDAVMRLFNFDESLLQLDLLGIPAKQRAQIDEIISHPKGLVLMVGPTGSGKSTTLYSMLNSLNTPDKKLITLEDPIEYGMTGMAQIPIDTTQGQSFGGALRSVLRLDPDVVMVGEIRDTETATTAIQASITGHLVLSSFHAASTSAAFSRLISMIGMNPIFSSAIRLLIAQRLVRKLVPEAREAYDPDPMTRQYLKRVLDGVSADVELPDLDTCKLYRPVKTDEIPFGYKGRIVIMEQMVVTDAIQAFLRGEYGGFSAELIEPVAKREGMLTLEQSGVLAALRGETTIEEVNRVL